MCMTAALVRLVLALPPRRVLWDHMVPADSEAEHPRKRKRPHPLRLEAGAISGAGFPGHGDGVEGGGDMDSLGLAANEKEAAQR